MAWLVRARQGVAWYGMAGRARPGRAWHGLVWRGNSWQAWPGQAWRGKARQGTAGWARPGWAWQGVARPRRDEPVGGILRRRPLVPNTNHPKLSEHWLKNTPQYIGRWRPNAAC